MAIVVREKACATLSVWRANADDLAPGFGSTAKRVEAVQASFYTNNGGKTGYQLVKTKKDLG